MANLTITVDPEVLKRARIKAIQEGTSVNKVLGAYLETFARDPGNGQGDPPLSGYAPRTNEALRDAMESGRDADVARQERIRATEELVALAEEARTGHGPEGRTWKREDLYDRPIMRRE